MSSPPPLEGPASTRSLTSGDPTLPLVSPRPLPLLPQSSTPNGLWVSPVDSACSSNHLNELDSLPNGWERRFDANGRSYYVDHNTRSTTWQHPVLQERGLAEGREHRRTPEGRPCFVDHRTKTTTWVDPRSPLAAATTLGPLPAGWEARFTSSGRVYFVNHSTRMTRWDDPRSAGASQS